MANLTIAQLRQYASNAGFSGTDLDIAVAVALAESEGNPKAHNAKPPDDSYGLWQINYYGSLRESRTKLFGPPEGLYDPQKNANAAFTIWKGSGWKAWKTYTSEKYKTT